MKPFENEMLNLMKTVSIDDLDPKVILECAGEHWNICDKGQFFEYLMRETEEYTVLLIILLIHDKNHDLLILCLNLFLLLGIKKILGY